MNLYFCLCLGYPDPLKFEPFLLIVPLSIDTQRELLVAIEVIDMRYKVVIIHISSRVKHKNVGDFNIKHA